MKKTATILKFICAGLIFVVGLITFSQGQNKAAADYSGLFTSFESYGGDAYTGIQNAVAETSRNINNIGDFLSHIINDAYSWGGTLLMIFGIYIFACTLASIEPNTIENNSLDETTIRDLTNYKSLLDAGAITQAEFEEIKKELLNL